MSLQRDIQRPEAKDFFLTQDGKRKGCSEVGHTSGTHPADKFSLLDIIFIWIVRTVLTSHQPLIDFPTHSNNFHVETTWDLAGQESQLFVCQKTVTASCPPSLLAASILFLFALLLHSAFVAPHEECLEQESKSLCCKNYKEISHWGDFGNNLTFKPVSGESAKCTLDAEHGECCRVCSAAFEVVLTEYI